MGRKGIVEELGTAIGIKFTMCHFAAKCRGARGLQRMAVVLGTSDNCNSVQLLRAKSIFSK